MERALRLASLVAWDLRISLPVRPKTHHQSLEPLCRKA